MKSLPTSLIVGAMALILMIACTSESEANDEPRTSTPSVPEVVTDESQLPADFPRELIPTSYDELNYTDMSQFGGSQGATFESDDPVSGAIQYYIELIGEPTLVVDDVELGGEKWAQWNTTPYASWALAVLGSDTETIVTITKIPQ